jgi:hypothetical protein
MTLSTAEFRRALGRLDGPEARQFLADLLAARGYRTAVEGRSVIAESPGGETTRLLVVAGTRSLAAAGRGATVDTVVTTGGPTADAVASLIARRAARGGDPPARVGPETLREWLVYALGEEERSALTGRYLGATEPSALDRVVGAVAGVPDTLVNGLSAAGGPSRRTVAVVAVAILAVAAAVAAGGFVPGAPANPPAATDGPGTAPGTVSPIPTGTDTAASTATAASAIQVGGETGEILPESCPLAPVGAHPAALRPTVIEGVSADGLEGWHLVATQNLTRFDFDPNDQQAGVVPDVRHIAVFEAPTGARFRLGIDRWDSATRARDALRMTGPWNIIFPWGSYTVWLEGNTDETRRASAEQLLAAVTTAEGVKLGGECVSALLSEAENEERGTATTG